MAKGLGHLFVTLNSSHFFNETDFEQYLLYENAIVAVRYIAVNLHQARRHGGHSGAVPPKSLLVSPTRELCPKERNRLGDTEVQFEA